MWTNARFHLVADEVRVVRKRYVTHCELPHHDAESVHIRGGRLGLALEALWGAKRSSGHLGGTVDAGHGGHGAEHLHRAAEIAKLQQRVVNEKKRM